MTISILFAFFFSFTTNNTIAKEIPEPQDSITVYIFLHESCIISQYYTLPLLELHTEYASEKIQFIGLFPNYSSKPEKIEAFKEKYKIPFELKTDYLKVETERFGATITPEVVVYNESNDKILYKGRIDDAYVRVGKRKRVTHTSELKDVLEAIVHNNSIAVSETKAIGCFINVRESIPKDLLNSETTNKD